MKLAGMCSQAVDYPKNGVPVNIEEMPRTKLRAKPDWKKVRRRASYRHCPLIIFPTPTNSRKTTTHGRRTTTSRRARWDTSSATST